MAHSFGVIACVVVLVTLLGGTSAQTTHVVLDNSGWVIPPNPDAYTTWAASKTFVVGDTLVFNFATGSHDVAQVSKASFDACTSTNVIGSIIRNGPANVILDTAGEHYYICAFTGHCSAGQKLMISVSGSPSTASPPMPSAPSPSTPPPMLSAPSPSTPPPMLSAPSPSTPPPMLSAPSPSTPPPSPSPSTVYPPSTSTASPPVPLAPPFPSTPPMTSTPSPSPSPSTDSPPSPSTVSPPMPSTPTSGSTPPMNPPNSASVVASASLVVIFLSILLNMIV